MQSTFPMREWVAAGCPQIVVSPQARKAWEEFAARIQSNLDRIEKEDTRCTR